MKMKNMILGTIGGLLYLAIEILYRGSTHLSMFFIGGACFLICGDINEHIEWEWDIPIWFQMILCSLIVTEVEFLSGLFLNVFLKLNIWDYSHLWGNIQGQICPLYSFFWFLLSLPAIVIDDYLRYWLFKEEKPHYVIK